MTDMRIYECRKEFLLDELLAVVVDTASQPIVTEEAFESLANLIDDIRDVNRKIEWETEWEKQRAEKKGSLEADKTIKAEV